MQKAGDRERIQAALDKLEELAKSAGDMPSAAQSVIDDVVQELRAVRQDMDVAEDQLQYGTNILENVPHAVIVTDLDFNIECWNKAAEAMYGFTESEVLGRRMPAVIHVEYPFDDPDEVLREFSDRGRWEGEVIHRRKDGKSIHVLASVTTISDHSGKPISVAAINQDITASKRAEEELRESEERFRSVAEMLPIPVAITRREDGTVRYANPAYSRALGLPATRLVGRKASEFYAQIEDRGRALARLEEQGQIADVEIESKRADGRRFWALASFAAITFGGEDAIVSAFRDITESKQLEQERERLLAQTGEMADALRAERDLLETLMESTEAQIAYLDPDFNFVQVNSAYVKGCGYTKDELIGRNHFELFPDEENQAIFEKVRDTAEPVKYEAKPFSFPERFELGTTYWDWTLTPVLQKDGSVQGLVLSLLDVTDLVRSNLELDAERARLKAIIETTPDGIVVADSECRILMTNPAADRIYARPVPYGEEWESHAQLELCHPDGTPYDPRDLPLTRSALDGELCDAVEMAIVWPDGQRRDLLASTAPIRDAEGSVAGAVGTFQDITERKRTRDALRRAAERLRLLHDLDSYILTAPPLKDVVQSALERISLMVPCLRASVALFHIGNGHFSLLAVYSDGGTQLDKGWRGELDSIGFLERLRVGEVHLIQDLQASTETAPKWTQLRAEGIRSYVAVPLLAEGVLMGSLNLGLATADGLSAEELEIAREVAEQLAVAIHQDRLREQVRRHTEELESLVEERTAELRATEQQFRAVFEGTAIGVALVDLGGHVLESNPALQDMLGYSREELLGLPFTRIGHPSDGPGDLLRYAEFVGGNEDHTASERRFVRTDGEVRWAHLTLSLVRAPSGKPLHIIAVAEDITEEKEAREALIKAEKLAVTGRLAASLAHEINNPLQAVIGCLGLAQESLADGEDIDRYLDVGLEELRRAADVVIRLREVQRASEPGERRPVDLQAVLEKTETLTRKRCEDKGVQASLHCSEELPLVNAEEGRLQQVFLNLILNAVDAMEDGGKLRITAKETQDPPGASIEFADTGSGIEAEVMQNLFDPFVTTKEQGLGLGLYVSQSIVEEYGGRIDAESQSGEGTTFTVWLPC